MTEKALNSRKFIVVFHKEPAKAILTPGGSGADVFDGVVAAELEYLRNIHGSLNPIVDVTAIINSKIDTVFFSLIMATYEHTTEPQCSFISPAGVINAPSAFASIKQRICGEGQRPISLMVRQGHSIQRYSVDTGWFLSIFANNRRSKVKPI